MGRSHSILFSGNFKLLLYISIKIRYAINKEKPLVAKKLSGLRN